MLMKKRLLISVTPGGEAAPSPMKDLSEKPWRLGVLACDFVWVWLSATQGAERPAGKNRLTPSRKAAKMKEELMGKSGLLPRR
jgi:hypothetical protein